MTLDLHDLLAEWDCPPGELSARTIVGHDGRELLQLRVDLGLLQMFPDGRPDGTRFHGLPSAVDYFRHEMRLGRLPDQPDDWRELERELYQINYRRVALSTLAEECLRRNDPEGAKAHIRRALRDIETCLEGIRLIAQQRGADYPAGAALRPSLLFHRGRLRAQLLLLQQRYEEAVEEAEQAADELARLLAGTEATEDHDAAVEFLRDLGRRLRRDYNIGATLRDRLAAAIESENFEEASRLRDELRRRQRQNPPLAEPPASA